MGKNHLFKTLVAFALMFFTAALPSYAGGGGGGSSKSDYYATVKAIATGATGAGKVYASTTETNNPEYKLESTSDRQNEKATDAPTFTFHLYAQAQPDGIFRGWYTDANCTGNPLNNETHYTPSVTGNTESSYTKSYYAKFVYHYFARVTGEVVGEGGSVTVNGDAGSAIGESGDITTQADAEISFTLSATKTDADHYFVGWYSDADCTVLVSDQAECTVNATTSAKNAESAPNTTYYAKFAEVDRSGYSFTLVANPAHFASIAGGEDVENLDALSFSLDGVEIESDAAPYFNLQLTPAGNIIYSVKLYDAQGDLVSVYGDNATEAAVYAIPNTDLSGARVVVESREGWYLTAKGDPAVITGMTIGGVTLNHSAEGALNEINVPAGDCDVQITVSSAELLTTLRFYNAAGEMIEMPFQNVKGETSYTHTISSDLIKNGTVEATGLELGDGTPYFYLKGNPEHFTSMKLGLGTSAASADYSIDLRCSAQGEINLFPTIPDGQKCYIDLVPASGVEYTITFNYTDGVTATTAVPNRTTEYKNEFYPKATNHNRGVVDIVSAVPLDASSEWSFTIVGNPAVFTGLRDNANGNATVTCSAEGVKYYPAGAHAHIQLQPAEDGKAYNAYFYKAGADITNPDEALFVTENINAKYARSWYSTTLNRQILNALGNGGTLVIKELVGVGTGTVTINIEGNASNLVVTNGSDAAISGLKEGPNTVNLTAATLSFTHKTNGQHLASVKCNGEPLTERNSEGKYSYTNKFAADGDVYDIVTDYDTSIKHNVYVDVPEGCESFVTEVTVDDSKITCTPGQPFEVSDGQTVRVQGDKLNYLVNAVSINDEPQIVNNSAKAQIFEDTHFVFDVTYIQRDKSFKFEIGSNAKGDMKTAINSYSEYEKTATVPYCDLDNPINFGATCTSSAEKEWIAIWKVNGDVVYTGTSFVYAVNENDVVRVDFQDGDQAQYQYFNVDYNLLGGLDKLPSVTVNGEAKEPVKMALKAGDVIVISGNEFVNVTGVKVFDEAANANADGNYEITVVDENLVLNITVEVNRSILLSVYVDGLDEMSQCGLYDKDNAALAALAEGRNEVALAAWYDLPLTLKCAAADEEAVLSVVLDDQALAADEETGDYTLAELADGMSLYLTVKESEVYETASVNEDGYGTFASHNDVLFPDSEIATVRAYIAVNYDEASKGVTFVRVTGVIPAGTGLLLQSTLDRELEIPVATDEPARASIRRAESEQSEPEYTLDDNLLVPAYKYVTIPAADEQFDRYLYTTEGTAEFRLVTEPVSSDSNQAYLLLPKIAGTNSPDALGELVNNEDGTLTGIEGVSAEKPALQSVYNIHGVKVAESLSDKTLAPGLYIVKGQKVVITK